MRRRAPRPALRPFVRLLWATGGTVAGGAPSGSSARERMLPAGTCHIAIRLGDRPVRLFAGDDDAEGEVLGWAVVGGPRAAWYVRDATPAGPALGVELEAGAAPLVLGVSAAALAHRHVPLDALWGPGIASLRDRIAATDDLDARLDLLEDAILARVPRLRGVHPAVAHALRRLEAGATVSALARETGYGARHLGDLFHDAVGLAPKVYARVRRFAAAVELSRAPSGGARPETWAAIAAAAGYADQAHLAREFRAVAGLTPGAYRALAPAEARHVPLGVGAPAMR